MQSIKWRIKLLHEKLKSLCENNNKDYKLYKKWCDNYFF